MSEQQRGVRGIDHIIVLVRGDRIEEVAAQWRSTLGLQFDDMTDEAIGVRVIIDLDSGIELIAPLGEFGSHGAFFTKYIEENGEGLQSVVFRVDDLDAATQRATEAGSTVLRHYEPSGTEPYAHRYDVFKENALSPINGVFVSLAQLQKKPGH